jgi:glycosyltransferase involved in cell wall biosynthesis
VELECAGDLDLRFMWRLRQLLTERRPDIVHCHSRRGGDFLGGQAAALAGIPAIVSRRVDNPEPGPMAALRYRKFRKVVAISEAIAAVLMEAGVEASKIEVIRSAVDAERFAHGRSRDELCETFGLRPEDQLVAAAGQLIARKGHEHLLAAAHRLKPRYPRLRVLLFGQGREERVLRRRAAALDVEDIVQFAGFRDDLDEFLGGFDLLVHTALAEGLGVIALKAQAAGVPVIAFAAGGLPEVVADEVTGRLVPPGDTAALSDAMAGLLDDSARRDRYAKAARERASREFGTQAMIDAHIRLYESVIDE